MGETLLSGLLRSGRPADDIVITEKRGDHAATLRERYGVRVLDNAQAAEVAEVLVLVVKPQDMDGLLGEIREHIAPGLQWGTTNHSPFSTKYERCRLLRVSFQWHAVGWPKSQRDVASVSRQLHAVSRVSTAGPI